MCVLGQHPNHLELAIVPYLDTTDIATTTFEKLVIQVAYFLRACDHYHQTPW